MQSCSHSELNCAHTHMHRECGGFLKLSLSCLWNLVYSCWLLSVEKNNFKWCLLCTPNMGWERLKANACSRVLSGSPWLPVPVQGKSRRQCRVCLIFFIFSPVKRRRCLTPQFPWDLTSEIVLPNVYVKVCVSVALCIASTACKVPSSHQGDASGSHNPARMPSQACLPMSL